jgi:hypothetical protein
MQHVTGCEADAVTVMTHQIGLDQILCDRNRLGAFAARALDHFRDEIRQFLMADVDHWPPPF